MAPRLRCMLLVSQREALHTCINMWPCNEAMEESLAFPGPCKMSKLYSLTPSALLVLTFQNIPRGCSLSRGSKVNCLSSPSCGVSRALGRSQITLHPQGVQEHYRLPTSPTPHLSVLVPSNTAIQALTWSESQGARKPLAASQGDMARPFSTPAVTFEVILGKGAWKTCQMTWWGPSSRHLLSKSEPQIGSTVKVISP